MTSRAPLADPQRRLHAFVLDQALALLPAAGVAVALAATGAARVSAVAAGLVVGLLVTTGLGALAGATGVSPGRAAYGLRLVDRDADVPVGAARGALRALLLAATGWVSAGTLWCVLALSVARDETACGRGWHDRRLGTRVVGRPAERTADADSHASPVASDSDPGHVPGHAPVPAPRRPAARVLPRGWQVEVDGGEVHDVADRLRLGAVEFARMPDGALALRDVGSTHGTLLVRDGAARTVAPGRVSTLLPDDRVRVGERWTRVLGTDRVAAPR